MDDFPNFLAAIGGLPPTPEPNLNGRSVPIPRGKTFGVPWAARRAGRTGGHPPKLTEDDLDLARALLANPDIGVTKSRTVSVCLRRALPMILHICSAAEWQASHDGHYRCPSLDHEGFIHCSTPEQVVEVGGRLFHGQRDLVLLVIDPDLVTAEIRREDGGNGNFYPHIYGPLNVSAVTAVVAFEPNPDGSFVLLARLHR